MSGQLVEMHFSGGPLAGKVMKQYGLPRWVTHCPSCSFCDAGFRYVRARHMIGSDDPARWVFVVELDPRKAESYGRHADRPGIIPGLVWARSRHR